MVGFDAHFVMLALRPAIPASVDQAKERVLHLLQQLQSASERIIVPTPALSEFLVHAEAAGPLYLDELQRSSRFKIGPYGIRAAVEVAQVIEAAVTRKDKRDGTRNTWAKVNFDRQIVGICKVEGCHTIYTDDSGVKTFSKKIGLRVIGLDELDLPPSTVPPLIQKIMDHEEAKTASSAAPNPVGLQPNGTGSIGNETRPQTKEEGKGPAQEGPAQSTEVTGKRPAHQDASH